ncbi:MAG: arylsulfatase A-like enzyme [Mariniblastus sp.]|jgi:arylsulfatase A-like enzyme
MRTVDFLTRGATFVVLALLSFNSLAQQAIAEERPNIVFIFSDDHSPNALGAYDGWLKSVDPTPNIDALARQGMLFKNSFCTNSICGPSRAVIITGKHSHVNGFMNNGNKFDGSQQTFPKLLQAVGYQTAMIGKWHLKSDPQGFDYWDVLPGQGDYYNPRLKSQSGMRTVEGHCTEIVTDLAIDWLDNSRDKNKPFLLMCQHKAPHRCWMPAPEHLDLYDDIDIPEPATLFDDYADNAPAARHQEMEIDRHMHIVYDLFANAPAGWEGDSELATDKSGFRNLKKMTPAQLKVWNAAYRDENAALEEAKLTGKDLVRWKYQRYAKNYLRCVRGVDDSVGRIVKYLTDNQLEDNTVVVYSSDQGFYVGDHGWYDKRWMYEESLKMPLIIKWPGQTAPGSLNTNLVQNLDYAETFLEMAGANVPDDMQGQSLVPLLKGETVADWRKSIYYHFYEYPSVHMCPKHNGVRNERYKLIQIYEFGEWEFYDLEKDPDELTNVYNSPEYQDEVSAMKHELERLREKYGDITVTGLRPAEWQSQYRTEK